MGLVFLAPAKAGAALVANLLQLLLIVILLFLAAGLAGWKLFCIRKETPQETAATGRSVATGRQR
jgi:hypothetical protein